jgi:protein gp37
MLPGWATSLRDQCQRFGIRFHFKQWGHWAPVPAPAEERATIRKFWDGVTEVEVFMEAKGKKGAGRSLDGIEWDELPLAV